MAELKACTPATPSPSNGVVEPPPLPKQKSSSAGSANHTPIRFSSLRTRPPFPIVEEKASFTIRLKALCPLPCELVVTSPMYSAAPNGDPAYSSRKTVKLRSGGRLRARMSKLSEPFLSEVGLTATTRLASGMQSASCCDDGVSSNCKLSWAIDVAGDAMTPTTSAMALVLMMVAIRFKFNFEFLRPFSGLLLL